jgi:hypothetical protein
MKKSGGFFCTEVRDTSETGRFNERTLTLYGGEFLGNLLWQAQWRCVRVVAQL